jgi:phage repressor protein C with HTH and peptisase S24 domain
MLTDRIKQIIQDSGLSLPRFAHQAGVSKNTLINYRDGVTSPAAEFLETVCREFSVNPVWLLMGDGDPYNARNSLAAEQQRRLMYEEYSLIPLLESRVTGGPEGEILYEDISDYYPFKKWWVEKLVGRSADRQQSLLLIRVRGDSMSPTINQGEMALVDTFEGERLHVLTGRIYLVILPDGTVALKRLVLSKEQESLRLACLSDNTAHYRPFEFSLDSDKPLKNYILGRVRWAGKEFD